MAPSQSAQSVSYPEFLHCRSLIPSANPRFIFPVILNLFQDLSKIQATRKIGKMLKQVQHDILIDNLPQNHPNRSTQKRQKGHKYIVSTKVRKGGKYSNVKRVTS